jgi:hypothetical protein
MGAIRTVIRAFRSECGKTTKSNPWPRCPACYRRVVPTGLCRHSTHLKPVCLADCR